MTKTNTSPMDEAMAKLTAHRIAFQRMSDTRLKAGVVNFNPYSGSIRVDGHYIASAKGLDAFIYYLTEPYAFDEDALGSREGPERDLVEFLRLLEVIPKSKLQTCFGRLVAERVLEIPNEQVEPKCLQI